MAAGELPENAVQPKSLAAWRSWLAKHHARPDGVWLVYFKKTSGKAVMDYNAAVEEALCFGWVDSLPRKLDEDRTMLWFAPRKAKSGWSRPNQQRVEQLIANGRMQPPGLAKVEAARRDGSWTKLDAVEDLAIPGDLAKAFRRFAGSAENFEAFPRSVKRGILEWIEQAKRPETRLRRVEETASLAGQNLRANQWPK